MTARRARVVALVVLGLAACRLVACKAGIARSPASLSPPTSPRVCSDGEAIDVAHDACIAARDVRVAAIAAHLSPSDDDVIACTTGTLAITAGDDGPELVCIPTPPARAARACAPGSVDDERGGCARVVFDGGDVDTASWARARLGVDGGEAAPSLCLELARSPSAFGLAQESDVRVDLSIDVRSRDNDVAWAELAWRATVQGAAARAAPSDVIARVLARREQELRVLGGRAVAAAPHIDVSCRLRGLASPRVTPRNADRGGEGASTSPTPRKLARNAS